jgi:hypothetical protein
MSNFDWSQFVAELYSCGVADWSDCYLDNSVAAIDPRKRTLALFFSDGSKKMVKFWNKYPESYGAFVKVIDKYFHGLATGFGCGVRKTRRDLLLWMMRACILCFVRASHFRKVKLRRLCQHNRINLRLLEIRRSLALGFTLSRNSRCSL